MTLESLPALHERSSRRALLALAAVSLSLAGELGAQTCGSGTSLLTQPIDYQNGFKSDSVGNDQVCADQVVLAQDTTLSSLMVTGTFSNNNLSNAFTLSIHADAAGLPGAVIYVEHNVSASLFDTGVPLPAPLVPTNEVEVTLTPAAPVALPAGTVWIHVYNDSPVDAFYWLTGTLDATSGITGSAIAFAAPGVSFSNLNLDLAMTLCCTTQGVATSYCAGDGSAGACPCANLGGTGEGCANSTGAGALLSASGSASVAADDLAFSGVQFTPGQPALLFSALNAVNGGLGNPFGDGLRCAGGSVERLGISNADASGTVAWSSGLAAAGGWLAGDLRRFQGWYRDPLNGPCGSSFNLSNGLEVVFVP